MKNEVRTAVYDGTLQVEAYRLQGIAQPFPAHFHDHYVIGLTEAGERRMICRGQTWTLQRGSMVLFCPGELHACVQANAEPFDYRGMNIPSQVMLKEVQEAVGNTALPEFSQPALEDAEAACCLRLLHQAIMEEDSSFRERLLELLGEQHQEEHSGVFTSRGYAEPGSDFKEVYRKGEMFCFARPSAPVVLEVRKGFFDDPSYDNDKTTILNLPASDADIWRAVGEVDAASLDECAFRCIDCEIPSLRDAVDDAIEQEGGIGMASEFATNLAQKKQSWHEADWVKYKALLSVAGHPHLQDAIQLMHGLDAYELRPDVAATWDYAELILREKYPDLPEELFQTGQAARVGQRMLEENHASITDYGLLRRKDSGQLPVFRKEQKEAPAWGGMEMA